MKRIFTFVLSVVTVVFLTACSVPGSSGSAHRNSLGCAFSSEVTMTIDRLEASGIIKRFGEGVWEIEFSEPNTLSGVKLEFSEGNVIASYKGLSFSVPQSAIPAKAMMLNLIKAVDDNAGAAELTGEESDGVFRVKGSLDGGDYILDVDENGLLSGFRMPNHKLTMRFTEMKAAEISAEQGPTLQTTEAVTETASSIQ